MQGELGFPQPLSEKYRPQSIAQFIGLEKQKKVLSAFARRPVSCAWMFLGPSGVGKSTMALALAKELNAELHHIPSQKCTVGEIDEIIRMCHRAPYRLFGADAGKADWHVVLVDEADQMSNAAQLALLSKLDSTDAPPQTIFVFTANDTGRLEPRFLSRTRVMEFSSYGMRAEIAALLAQVWEKETGAAGSLNWERIAKESNTNVRDALQTLEIELLAV